MNLVRAVGSLHGGFKKSLKLVGADVRRLTFYKIARSEPDQSLLTSAPTISGLRSRQTLRRFENVLLSFCLPRPIGYGVVAAAAGSTQWQSHKPGNRTWIVLRISATWIR